LAKQGIFPNVIMELDSLSAVKGMVQENLGITMLPERTIRAEIDTGSLVALDIADGKLVRPTVMAYPHHKKEEEAFQHLVRWIIDAY
jgi:LysR family transcriptional regulator, low CO2-responsive transcriptional regulator